jgi:type IV pilus assembly protein PilZ
VLQVVEQRRYKRAPIDLELEFAAKSSPQRFSGRLLDISVGGMYVQTAKPLPFGAELTVYVTLPGQRAPFALPAVVRWTRRDGMGVQFGLIGARETHAITGLTRGS